MWKLRRWCCWIGVACIAVLGITMQEQSALAAKNNQSNEIGFSVAAKIPKNQINKKNSFYDLKMKKGSKQVVQARIYNTTNRDIEVQTAIHTAYTNTNGIIEYVTPAKSFDQSLKYKLSDITKLQENKKVTIPANGSKVVSSKITMPNESFNGVILGGWYFKRLDSKVTGEVKGSKNLTNRYSYVIGMKLTEGTVPSPSLELSKVQAGMNNAHRGIFPYLRNTSAVIVPDLSVTSTVTSKNSGEKVVSGKKNNVQLAPNSVYKYPLLTGSKKLQAGKYHLHMVVKNSKHRWIFDKDFTITSADATKYNKASVDNSGMSIIWFVVFGALGMLILVLLILWLVFIIRRRRNK